MKQTYSNGHTFPRTAQPAIPRDATMLAKAKKALQSMTNFLVFTLILSSVFELCAGSEFPERECCDPVYPPNTETTPAAPVTHAIGKIVGGGGGEGAGAGGATAVGGAAGAGAVVGGVNLRTSIAILNCLLARQLCFEDASCSAILEIIPRVCGSELVACSTVTVTKCQAALRTLQAFPFFKPTCLCREPNVDPECNSFRDFLFDHPCVFVMKKEKDPYPVETLPTCTYALTVCHGEKACSSIFERFKNACKVRDAECRMDDRNQCKEAWAGLRMSPLFGCICPNNHMKKRCDRIFSVVNHNPCVVKLISDGRKSNRNSTVSVNAWIGGMSITQDGNLISPAKLLHHVHRYASPHYRPEGHHGHRWRLDPGGGEDPLYATKTVYGAGYIDENKRIGSENGKPGEIEDRPRINLQSTCHVALDSCIKNGECVEALTPVLQRCDSTRCDREGCMSALRTFYRTSDVEWNTEIAFCLCKKTENKDDPCMNAQERLHPSCAQRPPTGSALPACHTLAHACREDTECRVRLENYEQWCAVDSVTHGCAGAPSACRAAVTAVLGTRLRAACACRGTDFAQLYDCLGWQRLLWLNPCVVESQSDYHIKTYGSVITTTPFDNGVRYVTVAPERPVHHRTTTHHHQHTSHQQSANSQEAKEDDNRIVTTMSEQTLKPVIKVEQIAQISEPDITTASSTTTTTSTTTTEATTTTTTTTTTKPTTTTTRTTTTMEPAKYCVVQRPEHDDQYIKMGETRRLHRSAELSECTEVCACGASLRVSCHAACVPRAPCSSRLAHYSHAAPAYQAYRGRCYCYSGSFICMRPVPGEYKLPEGVYLLLGFSAVDEALLRPHTGLGAEDAVRLLQQYIAGVDSEGTNCTLTLFNISNENVIISASISPQEAEILKESGDSLLDREKEECIDLLKVIKNRINSQHDDISSHLLLSIFKIAEVDVIYPTPPSSAVSLYKINYNLIIFMCFLQIILKDSPFCIFLNFFTVLSALVYVILQKIHNINASVFHFKQFQPKEDIILDNYQNVAIRARNEETEKYFLQNLTITIRAVGLDELATILDVKIIDRHIIFTHALKSTVYKALASDSDAQIKYFDLEDTFKLDIDELGEFTELKHIIKAVSITIFNDINDLVTDVCNLIIPEYFSRKIYSKIWCTMDSDMLFENFDNYFGNDIASSSYGIDKSADSLVLNLEVD